MEHTNNRWDSLSMHERAKYIKLALDNGVSDLNMVRDSFNLYANGGNIHIKPENRGKFTELKERTGKSSTWYKENGTPEQKKMATFALNAAKWSHKHDEGGELLNNQTYNPTYNIPTVENGFEDWSKKYLGESYAEYDSNIQYKQDAIDYINELIIESNGKDATASDLKYAQESLNEAIKEKQDYLDYIYNQTINNIGEPIKNPIKNILYRIMSQDAGSDRTKDDIMRAIKQQIDGMPVFLNYTGGNGDYDWNNKNRDLNRLYLTGEDSSFERLPKNSRGFTYSDYLQKIKRNPEVYKGELLPNEIIVDPKYASALYNLIGKHTYVNATDPLIQDDVARHIQKVGVSPEGNLEIQASDVWDFYPGDWKDKWGFSDISDIGSRILNRVGHPFILRDYTPIKFGEPKNEDYIPWIENLPAYEGTDSDGTLMFSLPEVTVTADSETGKNIKASIGSTSFDFVNNSYDPESLRWYVENPSNKQESTKHIKNNNKAQGGYLNNLTTKPFSYKPIPAVRYNEGGLLQRIANIFSGLFNGEDEQSDGIDMNELASRQAYAESRYKSDAQSGAGARGLFQIMPSVLSDYNLKNNANYTVDDLYNDTINAQIRNWYFEDLMNRGWNTKNNPSDSVRVAKALAAYNYGSGNVVNNLNKAKAAGIDIYNGWDWLEKMPKETRDYVNFILRNQNSSLHRNNAAYGISKESNKDKVKLIKEGK